MKDSRYSDYYKKQIEITLKATLQRELHSINPDDIKSKIKSDFEGFLKKVKKAVTALEKKQDEDRDEINAKALQLENTTEQIIGHLKSIKTNFDDIKTDNAQVFALFDEKILNEQIKDKILYDEELANAGEKIPSGPR